MTGRIWHRIRGWLGLNEPLEPCARWMPKVAGWDCHDCGWPADQHGLKRRQEPFDAR